MSSLSTIREPSTCTTAVAGSIRNPLDQLVVGGVLIPVLANNPFSASGGDDLEGMDEIRANAPAYFKTAQRGVTQEDITTLANIYSSGVYGTVAKAKANIVRGIAGDYALQALLAGIDGHQMDLAGYLALIEVQALVILSAVTGVSTSRGEISDQVDAIIVQTALANSLIASGKGALASALGALDQIPYQQVLAEGDGSLTTWTNVQLDKFPVAPGSVSVWTSTLGVDVSGTNGNCSVAGILTDDDAGNQFAANMLGRMVLIGISLRQITGVIDANNIRYSGATLSGSGLAWTVYQPGVQAIDDANGGFTGTSIVPGSCSIDYATGKVAFKVTSPLPGDPVGNFGVNLMIQFGYEEQAARSYVTTADGKFDAVQLANAEIASDAQSGSGSISSVLTDIATHETDISDAVALLRAQSALALTIPPEIAAEVDALEAYLDEHLSGECRANIVIVQILVVDADGFYIAPTQALLSAVKVELEQWNVVPTTIATVSGFYNVVWVNMEIWLSVPDPYVYAEVKSRVVPVVDAMFKGRAYGEDLLRAFYYNQVVPDRDGRGGVTGVGYANISITGTTFPDPANQGVPPSVDANGNLFISEDYVLSRGTITYHQIT